MKDINIGIRNIILIIIFGFVILFYFLGFDGLIMSDDFTYALFAHKLFQGTYELKEDIFAHRFGVFVPTGILYKMFGVNDFTTTLWPLICFLGIGWMIFKSLKKVNATVVLYAIMFSSLSFYPIFFSNKLFPDVIVSFFAVASALILFNYREGDQKNITGPILFSLSVFAGFLTKETMLYLFPFYLLVLIHDLIKGKHIFFWLICTIASFVIAGIYFGLYQYYTGNLFYRFNVIQEGHYAMGYSYFDKPIENIFARITYEPLLMFISTEFFIPFALAFPLLIQLRPKDILDLENPEKYWSVLAIVLLAMFWFGSTSYKFYNPISLNARMFIMLIPFLSICAGLSVSKARQESKFYLIIILLLLAAILVSYKLFSVKLSMIYVFLFFFFLILFLNGRFFKQKLDFSIYTFLLLLILLIHPVFTMLKTDRRNFEDEKEIVKTYLNGKEGKAVVLTDPAIKYGSQYFYQFIPNEHYIYLGQKQAGELKSLNADKYYLLINPKNIQELMNCGFAVPEYYLSPPKNLKLVVKRGEVSLFEISDVNEILNYH